MELIIALTIAAAFLWAAIRCLGGTNREGGVFATIFLVIVTADIG